MGSRTESTASRQGAGHRTDGRSYGTQRTARVGCDHAGWNVHELLLEANVPVPAHGRGLIHRRAGRRRRATGRPASGRSRSNCPVAGVEHLGRVEQDGVVVCVEAFATERRARGHRRGRRSRGRSGPAEACRRDASPIPGRSAPRSCAEGTRWPTRPGAPRPSCSISTPVRQRGRRPSPRRRARTAWCHPAARSSTFDGKCHDATALERDEHGRKLAPGGSWRLQTRCP